MQHRDVLMTEIAETPAQVICRLAKEAVHQEKRTEYLEKVEQLRIFLAQGHAVDVNFYKKTPTMMLMEQGEENAAWMLVNQFGADAGGILYEYGRQHRFDALLRLMGKFHWYSTQQGGVGEFANAMDVGNAEHVQELYTLIDSSTEPKEQARVAATKLASKGKMELAVNIFLQYQLKINDLLNLYIAKGDMNEVDVFLQRNPEVIANVASFKIWNGYEKEASKEIEKIENIGFLTNVAAVQCNEQLVESLIARGAPIDEAVSGYAAGGYTEEVTKLLARGASRESAFYGYLEGLHYRQIEEYMPDRINAAKLPGNVKKGSGVDELRVLSFIQDKAKRAKLAVLFRVGPATLKSATEINNLMHQYNLDYEQAKRIQSDPKKNSIVYYLQKYQMSFEQAYSCASQPEMKPWLIKANALLENGFLNERIIALTTSYVGKLPYDDGETLREKMIPKKRAPTLFNHLDVPPVERGTKRNQVEEGDRKRRRYPGK